MRNETLKNYKSYLGSMITAYLRLMVVTPVLCICVDNFFGFFSFSLLNIYYYYYI